MLKALMLASIGLALVVGGMLAFGGLPGMVTKGEVGRNPAQVLAVPAIPPGGLEVEDGVAAPQERVLASVEQGLRFLKRTQDPRSGGWIADIGYKFTDAYSVTKTGQPHVGVSALALMAFLSGGNVPGRGEYGDVVERGTDYIMSCVDPESGYISSDGTRMYSHAFATLFLAEIYGMTHRSDVRGSLQLAVDLTVESQNEHGSWRYLPNSPESDMSITVCQIMALRAARNIGIRVPKTTIDRAYDYVVRSAIKRRGNPDYGGFKYQEQLDSRTTFPLTAAGIATLNHSGVYHHELINAGIEYLRRNLRIFTRAHAGHYFWWYGNYYASQVFFLAGDDERMRRLWSDFYWPFVSGELLRTQRADGSWPNQTGPGPAFSTAIACIILQIPNQYLPIFQR